MHAHFGGNEDTTSACGSQVEFALDIAVWSPHWSGDLLQIDVRAQILDLEVGLQRTAHKYSDKTLQFSKATALQLRAQSKKFQSRLRMVRKPKVHFPWSVAFFFVRTQWLLCWTFSGRRRRLTPPPSSFPPSMPVILHAGRVSDKRLDHERCSRPDTANIGLQRPMCLLLCFSPRTAAMWPFISFLLFLSFYPGRRWWCGKFDSTIFQPTVAYFVLHHSTENGTSNVSGARYAR